MKQPPTDDCLDLSDLTIDIYREHMNIASFLYVQRRYLIDDPDFSWVDTGALEKRMDIQMKALLKDFALAIQVCDEKVKEGRDGALFISTCIYLKTDRFDQIDCLLNGIDLTDDDVYKEVSDAFNYLFPTGQKGDLFKILFHENPDIASLALGAVGYQRCLIGKALEDALRGKPLAFLEKAIWSMGRARDAFFIPYLLDVLRTHEKLRVDAFLALGRMGQPKAIETATPYMNKAVAFVPVMLVSGPSQILECIKNITPDDLSEDILFSLGIAGHISAVPLLIQYLSRSEYSDTCAAALNLITGAELTEEIFIPDEIDPDLLFEEEKEKLKRGESLYADGERPGKVITRLVQDTDQWHGWWMKNQFKFKSEFRYRYGRLYSPKVLIDMLLRKKGLSEFRQIACEELVIRYHADFGFEIDIPMVRQKKIINEYMEWEKENKAQFQAGCWYCQGERVQ